VDLRRIPARWRRPYATLLRLREEALSNASHLRTQSRNGDSAPEPDVSDVASDKSERDLRLSFLSNEEGLLAEIEAALRRIEAGTYGTCELSGRRIPAARLRAIPWTRYTADAERMIEAKRGRGR
jgi:RNA polymerase-binding protein DksA